MRGVACLLSRVDPYVFLALKGARLYLKECLLSLKYLLVVCLILAPIAFMFKDGFGMLTKSTRFAWTESAPSSLANIIFLIDMFTLGPVAEEFFFRGFLYNALRSRLTVPIAASIQAIIFSLIHGENLFGTIEIFAIGFALAFLYERRRNLLSPILLHAMQNAMVAIPLLVLTCTNYHVPAHTWEEAKQPPPWLNTLDDVERQGSAIQQWEYAIDRWGSKGSRRWKKEAAAFKAVGEWYPEERLACAKSELGIVSIYYYRLNDFRRVVVEADDLLRRYPEQREQCGEALCLKGWAYYRLREFIQARRTFEIIREQKVAVDSASEGIKHLKALEKRQ